MWLKMCKLEDTRTRLREIRTFGSDFILEVFRVGMNEYCFLGPSMVLALSMQVAFHFPDILPERPSPFSS
jgi:hypothetical protein